MIQDQTRFKQAIDKIDIENSQDPNMEIKDGHEHPKELLYSQRMSEWLEKFEPEASEALKLAARSQHICRWTKPRDQYPMGRKGYLLWRTELKSFHARKTGKILMECSYEDSFINKVKSLILKEKMKVDREAQTLEDVICLVFLENYFADFSSKHDEAKVIGIVQKTWRKMSEKGRSEALELELPKAAREIIEKAVGQS